MGRERLQVSHDTSVLLAFSSVTLVSELSSRVAAGTSALVRKALCRSNLFPNSRGGSKQHSSSFSKASNWVDLRFLEGYGPLLVQSTIINISNLSTKMGMSHVLGVVNKYHQRRLYLSHPGLGISQNTNCPHWSRRRWTDLRLSVLITRRRRI
jgi:hypothetical protein